VRFVVVTAELSQVFWCRGEVEAAATGLTAGSLSSFSTFCHKNRGNVKEENIIRERLYW
jgi:hypothetical protein